MNSKTAIYQVMLRRGLKGCGAVALALTVLLVGRDARADVRFEGEWPPEDSVSLSLNGESRSSAIEKLARAAGWSLVGQQLGDNSVQVQVQQQAPRKVLEQLLSDGDYVVKRDGTLVSINRVSSPALNSLAVGNAAPHDAKPPVDHNPTPALDREAKGQDRMVTGELRVKAGEVVHDLVVLGGQVTVEGTVTGDLVVLGGHAHLLDGALVKGAAFTLGGTVRADQGARINGDAVAFGGSLELAEGATVDKDVGVLGGTLRRGDQIEQGTVFNDDKREPVQEQSWLTAAFGGLVERIVSAALLWVFGAILLALAARRMAVLQVEIAARPWRALGIGFVSVAVALAVFVMLLVTLIGIPLALIGALATGLASYVGYCAVVFTVGTILVRHKTPNPYVHLALGCAAYLLLRSIPFVGGIVNGAAVLIGVGAMVATRGAGLLRRSQPSLPQWSGPEKPAAES